MRLIPPIIAYKGTVTGLKISSVDGTAFVDGLPAGILALPLDGTHLLEIYDAFGRANKGVLSAVGTLETLDDELLSDPLFDVAFNWDAQPGWAIAGGLAVASSTVSYIQTTVAIATLNKLIKVTLSGNAYTSGEYKIFIAGSAQTSPVYTDGGDKSWYVYGTSANGSVGIIQSGSDLVASFAGLSVKQVTAPSSSGALIVSAKGGATRNFSYVAPSFTFNSSSYYVVVRKLR